jgi:hypothetical protein
MTFEQFLFVLMGPVSVLVTALVVFVMTRRQDEREARKRAAKDVAPHRP